MKKKEKKKLKIKIIEQNKKPKNSINQSEINMFFGLNPKDVNKKTDTSEEQTEKTDKTDSGVKKEEENINMEEIKNDEEIKKDNEINNNVQNKNEKRR